MHQEGSDARASVFCWGHVGGERVLPGGLGMQGPVVAQG